MPQPISLLLGVHAHQPVGNFADVLEDAHQRCYQPFLHTLYRYPQFHFAIHFSGWLLDCLFKRHPHDMALLGDMVARGQAELFGGGDTEPVLAVIPSPDRLGQLCALSAKLERRLGQRPQGAWLTERVWEATVVPALADAGIRYVTVDDYHFLCTGKTLPELTGFYTTEEDGRTLDLFPISEALRYRLPFSPAAEAVQYLESLADSGNRAAAIYFDDIEKFGIWPETYEWVYEKRWLEDFIQGVLASDKIRTERYSDYHGTTTTRGIVYLPTTSYSEMNEWTLPAAAAQGYADLVEDARSSGKLERNKAFLRGGIWKNFFSRYPESNWMHKRMLELSRRFHALPEVRQTAAMRESLYEAQANDAYWHGLFGGLYLPHLRRAVYRALLQLEALLDQSQPRPTHSRKDLDLDGHDEVFLQNAALQAVIKLDDSASIMELDVYALGHNFGDTLARCQEHYYRKIHLGAGSHHEGAGIASAHDRISFKHEISAQDLAVDDHARTLFRDSWLADSQVIPLALRYTPEIEPAGRPTLHFAGERGRLLVNKQIALTAGGLCVSYRFDGEAAGDFLTEINLAMPSCDGPAGRFLYHGHVPGGFGQPLQLEAADEITLQDDVLGSALILRFSKPARFRAQPLYTVSQSEAGFEKIMQALTITLAWPLEGGPSKLAVELEIVGPGA